MTNEELAELERLLAEVDAYSINGAAKDRRYEHLGRWVSLKRKSLIATAREAEALRAENARLTKAFEVIDPAQLHPVAAKLFRAALEQGEVK